MRTVSTLALTPTDAKDYLKRHKPDVNRLVRLKLLIRAFEVLRPDAEQ